MKTTGELILAWSIAIDCKKVTNFITYTKYCKRVSIVISKNITILLKDSYRQTN